jgi:hypothetical protein
MTRISSFVAGTLVATIASVCLWACGVHTVRVEPVKVEPIHVTVDVNLHDASTAGAARR